MGAVVGQRGWPLAPVDQRITPPGRPPRRLASVWRSGSIQRDAQSGSCARMRRRRSMDSAPPHPRCAARPQSDVRVACEQGQAPDVKRVRIPDSRSQALLNREAARQCRRSRGGPEAASWCHGVASPPAGFRKECHPHKSCSSGASKRTEITRRASRTRREVRNVGSNASGDTTVTSGSGLSPETPATAGLRPVARFTTSSKGIVTSTVFTAYYLLLSTKPIERIEMG